MKLLHVEDLRVNHVSSPLHPVKLGHNLQGKTRPTSKTLAINDEYGVERVENHLICHSLVEFVRKEWSFNAYSLL